MGKFMQFCGRDELLKAQTAQEPVAIMLDRQRNLQFTFGTFIEVERLTGKEVHEIFQQPDLSFHDYSILMWAALVTEDPSLTVDDVTRLLFFRDATKHAKRLRMALDGK